MIDLKWFFLLLMVIAICLTGGIMVNDITKPKLTDPIAQRIWAASHGSCNFDSREVSAVVKEATLADSTNRGKK